MNEIELVEGPSWYLEWCGKFSIMLGKSTEVHLAMFQSWWVIFAKHKATYQELMTAACLILERGGRKNAGDCEFCKMVIDAISEIRIEKRLKREAENLKASIDISDEEKQRVKSMLERLSKQYSVERNEVKA